MPLLRLLCAVTLLLLAPFAGAWAAAHHHCHDVWHGHADEAVSADEDCGSQAPNLPGALCDDCGVPLAAEPFALLDLRGVIHHAVVAENVSAAQAHIVFSHFRPPQA
jgi:hypothetical protein